MEVISTETETETAATDAAGNEVTARPGRRKGLKSQTETLAWWFSAKHSRLIC